MLVLSCGGTERVGSCTFTSEVDAFIYRSKKQFLGYKTSTICNQVYNTHIVFYRMT